MPPIIYVYIGMAWPFDGVYGKWWSQIASASHRGRPLPIHIQCSAHTPTQRSTTLLPILHCRCRLHSLLPWTLLAIVASFYHIVIIVFVPLAPVVSHFCITEIPKRLQLRHNKLRWFSFSFDMIINYRHYRKLLFLSLALCVKIGVRPLLYTAE